MLGFIYRLALSALHYSGLPVVTLFGRNSRKWRNRFGRDIPPPPAGKQTVIWAHSASVGEVKALGVLLRKLLENHTDLAIVLSVMTDRGFETAKQVFAGAPAVTVMFAPIDSPGAVKRALDTINPALAIFAETEIWPNTVELLAQRAIPLALVNARISGRSYPRYMRLGKIIRHALRSYAVIDCQSQQDAERFISLGAPAERVTVSGNLKSESSIKPLSHGEREIWRKKLGVRDGEFLFVCGSVRPGEETALLDMYCSLKADRPDFRMALAPRHDELHEAILSAAHKRDIPVARMSTVDGAHDAVTLVDIFGILDKLYGAAELAFVGGTLAPFGGHNILEPVQAGTPALFGPHIENVRDSAETIVDNNHGRCVADIEELERVIRDYLKKRLQLAPIETDSAGERDTPSNKILTRLLPILRERNSRGA